MDEISKYGDFAPAMAQLIQGILLRISSISSKLTSIRLGLHAYRRIYTPRSVSGIV